MRQRGFTLIEMIMAITVMGIIALVGAQILASGAETYTEATESMDTFAKARQSMTRIVAEIREADYNGTQYLMPTMNTNQIVFTKRDGVTVTIATSGSNVTLGYSSPAVTSTLTDQLSSLAFAYYQNDAQTTFGTTQVNVAYVQVTLTLSEAGTLYTRRQRVALRDKP
jgi:prepilin-type N-terminal cleavage/methylation domain-containing protein